jgi:hypothetical protein
MIQRWRLIPSRRSSCRGPLSSWMQIRRNDPTWRASCRYFTIDSLSRGYPG